MSARIRIGSLDATLDVELRWTVHAPTPDATSPRLEAALLEYLNAAFGPGWEPPFGVYIPNELNARAEAAANSFGGIVVKLEEPRDDVPGRVY